MKKYVFVLLVFGCIGTFFYFFNETIDNVNGDQVAEGRINKSSEDLGDGKSDSRAEFSSRPSVSAMFSSNDSSEARSVVGAGGPWVPFSPSREIQDKVDSIIGDFSTSVIRTFIKIDSYFLDQIEVGGIYEVAIPDGADADMHVVNIEKRDGLTNVTGHLSGYPESYFIGFSYDREGHIYGEITTERANYSIKTFYGQAVVFKILPEMEKNQINDF